MDENRFYTGGRGNEKQCRRVFWLWLKAILDACSFLWN